MFREKKDRKNHVVSAVKQMDPYRYQIMKEFSENRPELISLQKYRNLEEIKPLIQELVDQAKIHIENRKFSIALHIFLYIGEELRLFALRTKSEFDKEAIIPIFILPYQSSNNNRID